MSGRVEQPRAAVGGFPYPMRTVAQVDAEEFHAGARIIGALVREIVQIANPRCNTCGGLADPACTYWSCPARKAA